MSVYCTVVIRAAVPSPPSTRHFSRLPPPARLQPLCQALTVLDRILTADASMRYFDYDPKWGAGGALASMRSGEGDQCSLWFSPKGMVVAGYDPEAPFAKTSPPERLARVYAGLPRSLWQARVEFDDVTFAAWRLPKARAWTARPPAGKRGDFDGSARLLTFYDDDPATYVRHARAYFDRKLALADVKEVYAGRLDAGLVHRLNPDAKPGPVLAFARKLDFAIGAAPRAAVTPRSAVQAKARVPAAIAKRLAKLFDPDFLIARLTTLALIDAIVAPDARSIEVELAGKGGLAKLAWGGAVLHAWVSGQSGVLYGWPEKDSRGAATEAATMPAPLAARWRKEAPNANRARFVAWSTGDKWNVDAFDAASAVPLECLHPLYLQWAKKHYGRALSAAAATQLWLRKPLTREIAVALSPSANWRRVAREAVALKWRVKA